MKGDRSEDAPSASPPEADEGTRDLEQAWLTQTRWLMDHVQSRADRSLQALWSALGLQGVLVALSAPLIGGMGGAARWLVFGGTVSLAAGAVKALVAALPTQMNSVDVQQYKPLWREHFDSASVTRPEALFVEELLQAHGSEESPIASVMEAVARRYNAVKWGVVSIAVAIVLIVLGLFVELVERG